jgi:hypothetical protein
MGIRGPCGGTSAHMMGTPAGAGEALERGMCEELGTRKESVPTDVSAFSRPIPDSVGPPGPDDRTAFGLLLRLESGMGGSEAAVSHVT